MKYYDTVPELFTHKELVDFFTGCHRPDLKAFAAKLTFSKHSSWAYEKEWRIEAFRGRDRDAAFEDAPFGRDELAGVIFGINTTESDKMTIRLLAGCYPQVVFYQASKLEHSFDLGIERLQ